MADTGSAISAPGITLVELLAFHNSHFSTPVTQHFEVHFLGPTDQGVDEEEDDGLGYYDDGVKRTLSDEQIAMFRHSELQTLLRQRTQADERRAYDNGSRVANEDCDENEVREVADSAYVAVPVENREGEQREVSKGKKSQQKSHYKRNVKPDLRKRTWDKVERGMESLDYGEEVLAVKAPNPTSQRRHISYEDV